MSRLSTPYPGAVMAISLLLWSGCENSPRPPTTQTTPTAPKQANGGMPMGAVDSVQGNFVHKELVVLSQRYDPPVVFDQGLQRLLDDYLDLSSALFDDDVEKLRDAAGGMRERVTSLELSSKVPAAEEAWAGHQLVLQTSLHAIALATTRAERTEHFSHISEAMYCALRSFDSVDETVFVAFCPMALNGHGAYWLAKSTVIANPYMGAEMASCGEIAETLDA